MAAKDARRISEDVAYLTWVKNLTCRQTDVSLDTFKDGGVDGEKHVFVALCDAMWPEEASKFSGRDKISKQVEDRLNFIKTTNVKTENIKARDLLKGNKKILFLLKNIFLHHLRTKLKQEKFGKRADVVEDFLLFLNEVLAPDYEVHDFATEWFSGSALWLLIHRIRPSLCVNWRNLRAADKHSNVEHALYLAYTELGIPQVFKAEDLISGKLDPWNLIVYLSQFVGLRSQRTSRPLPQEPFDGEMSSFYESVKDVTLREVDVGDYLTPAGLAAQKDSGERTNGTLVYENVSNAPIIHIPSDGSEIGRYPDINKSRKAKSLHISDRQRHGVVSEPGRGVTVMQAPPAPRQTHSLMRSSRDTMYPDEDFMQQSGPNDKIKFPTPRNEREFWANLREEGRERFKKLHRYIKHYDDMKIAKEPIGTGRFGGIQIARCRGEDNVFIMAATKCLPQNCIVKDVIDFLNDAELMASFNHRNILPMTAITFHKAMPLILMPLITEGDLKEYLEKSVISQRELLSIVSDIGRGMDYLSSFRYVHRNLSTRSCLVTKDDNGQTLVMIGDFGSTRDTLVNKVAYMTSELMPMQIHVTPPEVFSSEEPSFDEKTDVWSFGVVLWEAYSKGKDFMAGTNLAEVIKKLKQADIKRPQEMPNGISELMKRCLHMIPAERPRFKHIVQHLGSVNVDVEKL